MDALQIVQIIFAIATIATGLVSLAVPRSVRGFTGLDGSNARGITEIRAILGGAFIGLGAARKDHIGRQSHVRSIQQALFCPRLASDTEEP
jgi:hypothetical protein